MKAKLDMTLYLVTDSTYHTEESFYKTIEEACQGGVTLVQLREKNCGGREYLEKARKVKAITDRYQIPLIIDDRVDVAIACDAAGVHVGSSDLPVSVARELLGPDKIVGATAKTVEAAKKAYEEGCGLPWRGSNLSDDNKGGNNPDLRGNTERDMSGSTDSCGSYRWTERWKYGCAERRKHGWNRCGICDHESRASEGSSTETESACKKAEKIKRPRSQRIKKTRYGCVT